MKQPKTFLPLPLGFVPILIGELCDLLLLRFHWTGIWLMALLIAALWCWFGFLSRELTGKAWLAVCLLNFPALLDLLLLGIQESQGAYWFNLAGRWSQIFFQPLFLWGARLSVIFYGEPLIFPACCFTFLLMVGLSALGCCIHKKTARGN